LHPYRDMPLRPDDVVERVPPREESVLLLALVMLGGFRVFVAIHDGLPFDGEATVALLMVLGAAWLWVRRAWRRARSWWRYSGGLHDPGTGIRSSRHADAAACNRIRRRCPNA